MTPENKTLLIIYINIVLYATCFQLQRPLEPFLVDRLVKHDSTTNPDSGSSAATEYAHVQSFFNAIQTFGALLSGMLVDRIGIRGGFMLTFLSSAASYTILAYTDSVNMLYISKIPAVFQAGFMCAQAAVSQATSDGPQRIAALGKLTMAYTIGVVVGPMLGGYLGAHGDYQLGALLAAGGSILSALLTLLMPAPQVEAVKKTDQPVERPSMWSVVKLVWPLLLAKTLTGFANAMRDTAQPLILKSEFQFGEREMGITMAVTAAANALVNGLLLGQIASFFGSRTCTLIADCVGVSAVLSLLQAALLSGVVSAHAGDGLFGTAFHLFSSHRLWVFLFGSFLLTIVQYLLATAITSESTARVDAASRGTLIGLEHSLFAAARIASPATSVALMALGGAADGMSLVQCGGASLFVLVWFVLKACQQPSSKSKTA